MPKQSNHSTLVRSAKALVAALGGLYITFSQVKGWYQTILVLALFCLGQVAVVLLGYLLSRDKLQLLSGLPVATTALAVAILAAVGNSNEPPVYTKLHALLITWGLLAGAFGIWQARRTGKLQLSNAEFISALLALAFALTLLPFPQLDIITTEGLFGAYLIIDAVNLGIAAAGPREKQG